jgi:hypothetical protein
MVYTNIRYRKGDSKFFFWVWGGLRIPQRTYFSLHGCWPHCSELGYTVTAHASKAQILREKRVMGVDR